MPEPSPPSAFARFAQLLAELETAGDAEHAPAALRHYLDEVAPRHPADAGWALQLLSGARPPQRIQAARLREAAPQVAGMDEWLFAQCLQASGDLAETLALVLPPGMPDPAAALGVSSLAEWLEQGSAVLATLDEQSFAGRLRDALAPLETQARIALLRLLAGPWRAVMPPLALQRAVAAHSGLPSTWVAERMAAWRGHRGPRASRARRGRPEAGAFASLVASSAVPPPGQPHAFHPMRELPSGVEALASALGDGQRWQLEWHHDGVRVQVVRRASAVWVWTSDGELVTEQHEALAAWALQWPPGCVLEGMVPRIPARPAAAAGAPLFMAFDALEVDGVDLRAMPLAQRRGRLEALLEALLVACAHQPSPPPMVLSPVLRAPNTAAAAQLRQQARAQGARGLVIKPLSGAYGETSAGASGCWWHWPSEPLSIRAVLLYAQPAAGVAAATDYTFAVWSTAPANESAVQAVIDAISQRLPPKPGALCLLPVARVRLDAHHPLADALAQRVRESTVQSFGPVRCLRPTLVAELAFDEVLVSTRHKSGVSLLRPKLTGVCDAMALREVASLATVRAASHVAQAGTALAVSAYSSI